MATSIYISGSATLTGSAATQGTAVPTSPTTKRVVKSATATNPTGAAVALRVWLVPLAGSASDANCYIHDISILPNASYTCPEVVNQGLNAGGFLQALGNGLTFSYTAVDIS